jgi:hypothetical protein
MNRASLDAGCEAKSAARMPWCRAGLDADASDAEFIALACSESCPGGRISTNAAAASNTPCFAPAQRSACSPPGRFAVTSAPCDRHHRRRPVATVDGRAQVSSGPPSGQARRVASPSCHRTRAPSTSCRSRGASSTSSTASMTCPTASCSSTARPAGYRSPERSRSACSSRPAWSTDRCSFAHRQSRQRPRSPLRRRQNSRSLKRSR